MVDHLVFFAMKDDAPKDEMKELLSDIRALQNKVPGVVDLSLGEDFSGRSGEYTHALFVRFGDREGLKTYATHPEHIKVVEKLEKLSTGRIVCDYEH